MKNRHLIILIALVATVLTSAIVTAQAFLSPVILGDIQANGKNLGYFHRLPTVHKWNVTGIPAAVPSISGSLMTVAQPVQANVNVSTPSTTCTSALRGQYMVVEQPNNGVDGGNNDAGFNADSGVGPNPDGGRKDLVYQCCKAAAGTYSWIAVGCQ